MENKKIKYIEEEFNLFRIIETCLKRKFIFLAIVLTSLSIGILYLNNSPQKGMQHQAQINIEEGSNWENDFVKNLKVLVIYDTFTVDQDPETKIDINNVDVTLNEYMTYRYYDFKGYQESVINVSSKTLYNQFASLINNKVLLREVIKNSTDYLQLEFSEKKEIDNLLNNLDARFQKNPFDNLYKVFIDVKHINSDYEKNKKNINFILKGMLNYLKDRIITQLNILLTTYKSNLERDFYTNKDQQEKLFEIVQFHLNTHLNIAKSFDIKKNMNVEINENGRDYYLKGYELIDKEIKVLEEEIQRNKNIEFDLSDDIFIEYLTNDIEIMEKNRENFDIVKFTIYQYPNSSFDNSYLLLLLCLIIGVFLSILTILTVENYLIYKKNKLVN